MLESYVGIEKISSFTLIEKKSRFYAFAIPVMQKTEIKNYLNDFRIKYSDATHICYAYVINDNGVQEKFSDDGEPSGTAGNPICAVIKKRNLTNVLIIVVRYFGKIKLGAGGLIRAYSSCASGVLDECIEHKYFLVKKINFSFDSYDYYKYEIGRASCRERVFRAV